MRVTTVVVAACVAVGCAGDDTAGGAIDAAVDARLDGSLRNPPLTCPTSNPFSCTEPLPSLVGTWKFSPSTTLTITFTATANTAIVAGATANATLQMMHLFDGDWNIEATNAWECRRNGSATTISAICKRPTGELSINGSTRVPGFHTAYETTEFFTGTLVP